MTVAVSDGAPAPPPPPGPELSRPVLAVVKALMFACLAILWAGGASAAAAAVILAVHLLRGGSPLIDALISASLTAILLASLFAKAVFLLLLRAAFRDPDSAPKTCGSKLRGMLHDTAWFGYVVAMLYVLLSLVGCLVVVEQSKGSRVSRIDTLSIDVGAVISTAIACFDILPSVALKLWRMKPPGAAADGSVV